MHIRVLVFGTFDGLHAGHLFFLKQARGEGDSLYVSVARDSHVYNFKSKSPKNNEQQRLESILKRKEVDGAELSDKKQGSYEVITRFTPDIICLGYDQKELELSLRKWMSENNKEIPIRLIKKLTNDEYGKNMG